MGLPKASGSNYYIASSTTEDKELEFLVFNNAELDLPVFSLGYYENKTDFLPGFKQIFRLNSDTGTHYHFY